MGCSGVSKTRRPLNWLGSWQHPGQNRPIFRDPGPGQNLPGFQPGYRVLIFDNLIQILLDF